MSVTITRTKHGDVKAAVLQVVKDTNMLLGVQIASQAKALAPVDTGQLRNSLSASSLTQMIGLNDHEGAKAEKLDTSGLTGNEVYVGSNSDHAVDQEYGVGSKNIVAQPFLRPAAELKAKGANVSEIVAKYNRTAMEAELKNRITVVKNG